ncbi:MAG: class I SAM-dependent methyltransferase [Nanobdellota archaeon]
MNDHYFSSKQSSKEVLTKIRQEVLGNQIELESSSGVFSCKKIDKGSLVLINNCIIRDKDRVLDLGCAYGAVGISLALAYDIKMIMTDINNRAVKLARKNAKKNGLKDIKILQGDGFEKVEGLFDTILLNPPQSAGKDVCESLIEQSRKFLKEGGTLQVVIRKNKGGKSLSSFMRNAFGNLEVLAKSSGYWVYCSVNYHKE